MQSYLALPTGHSWPGAEHTTVRDSRQVLGDVLVRLAELSDPRSETSPASMRSEVQPASTC